MPFSPIEYVQPISRVLHSISFSSVLDLGTGIGQWGALARTIGDLQCNRMQPGTWQKLIHGVEIYEAYKNPTWDLYNRVYIDDIRSYIQNIQLFYDIIIAIEVLEHIEKEDALKILHKLKSMHTHLIFSYCNIEQGAWGGNDYEVHRSKWTHNDILNIFPTAQLLFSTDVHALWYSPRS